MAEAISTKIHAIFFNYSPESIEIHSKCTDLHLSHHYIFTLPLICFCAIAIVRFNKVVNEKCDILDKAIERYKSIIERMPKLNKSNASKLPTEQLTKNDLYDPNFVGNLNEIVIDLKKVCEEKPHPQMMEECEL